MHLTTFLKLMLTLSNSISLLIKISIQRTFKPGEQAPFAHQNQRVFPDWYKPYLYNYNGEGYLVVILGTFLVCNIFT